jgi:hypothetical protein
VYGRCFIRGGETAGLRVQGSDFHLRRSSYPLPYAS